MEKIGRTKIVDLLKREDIGAMVNVKGWVRTRRGSKQVNFIALNDGSTINNVQIVVDLANFDEEMLKLITTGACISVNGVMVQCSAFVTTWRLLFTSFSMKRDFSISIHRLSQVPTVKVPDRCFR